MTILRRAAVRALVAPSHTHSRGPVDVSTDAGSSSLRYADAMSKFPLWHLEYRHVMRLP